MAETMIHSSRASTSSDEQKPDVKKQSTPLNDKWVLYAHLPHDTDWSINSYKRIAMMSTIEQVIAVSESIPDKMIINCMLFLMRSNINPMWEDPLNKSGGCFSYKINNNDVASTWKKLSYVLVGETLIVDKKKYKCINGITISPKKNFCIIKIWLKDCSLQNPDVINYFSGFTNHGSLFKKHIN